MAQIKGIKVSDIVEAALAETVERGFEAATMDGIARRAGISRSTLQYYFPKRDVLYVAVRDRIFEPMKVAMTQAADDPSPVRGLRYFIQEYLHYFSSHPPERSFYLMGLLRMQSSAVWRLRGNEHESLMRYWLNEMLIKAVGAGEVFEHDTWSRTVALFCALEGAIPYLALGTKPMGYQKVSNRLEHVFLAEILRKTQKAVKRGRARNPKSKIPNPTPIPAFPRSAEEGARKRVP